MTLTSHTLLATALATMLWLPACASADAPESRLSVEYAPGGSAVSNDFQDLLEREGDQDATAFGLTYEFLPLSDQIGLAVSGLRQEMDGRNPNQEVELDVVRAQLRFHFGLFETLSSYLGFGAGYAVRAEGGPGTDYDGGLYADTELGLRWQLGDQWGVQGSARTAWIDVEDSNRRPGSYDQAFSQTYALGVYLDF